MREPWFWRDLDPRSRAAAPLTRALLTPAAALYAWAGRRRIERAHPFDPGLPVVCIGNVTLGGAGKTPVAAEVRQRLTAAGLRAATLSRGYGGRITTPVRVDPAVHTSSEVGDEPLLLAAGGESWIGRDRPLAADAMAQTGVEAVVMDDGHQNPTLRKHVSLVVVDAAEPFGNGFVFPKGPLREPVARALARADAVVVMGDGGAPPLVSAAGLPVFAARLEPAAPLPSGDYVAFAGIGRPQRFFDALARFPGVRLADAVPYPDHHPYTASDIAWLERLAAERGARLVTTAKDQVRLPPPVRPRVDVLPVEACFADPPAFDAFLFGRLAAAGFPVHGASP